MEPPWKFVKRHDLPQHVPSRSSILALTHHGHEALRALVKALQSETPNDATPPNITLLSVQLKGWRIGQRFSPTEWGTASFDTEQLFTTTADDPLHIDCHNIERSTDRVPVCGAAIGFHFGQTELREMWEIPLLMDTTLSSTTKETILIGHGIWATLKEAAGFKINLEMYQNIKGVVEITDLCAQILRGRADLPQMLTHMGIPFVGKSLGCAGNEARLSLLATFGLIWGRLAMAGGKEPEGRVSVLIDIAKRRKKGVEGKSEAETAEMRRIMQNEQREIERRKKYGFDVFDGRTHRDVVFGYPKREYRPNVG